MEVLFSRVLNMSLTGSIVIAVVLLARLFLKRAPKIYSYALWAVVLFRLLCPLSVTAGLSVLKPLPVTTTPGISAVSYQSVARAVRENIPVPVSQQAVPAQTAQQPETSPMQIAAYIWAAGASVMALYSIVQYLILRRRLAEAAPLQGEIYLADRISSPFVMGIFRPRIYLPSSTPMEERRFIVAHERQHIRRGDPLWKLLGYAALCLHWFNPLVWVAFVLAGKDMEMSCDEAVLKKLGEEIRADYSSALLRLATHKKIIAGMPLAFGEGDTKGRVKNMAKWKKPKVWVSLICLFLCIIILVVCAVNPDTAGSKDDIHAPKIFGEITADNALNIREKPKASSAAVGNYPSGEIVTILETKNGWGRTDRGWIFMDYVTTFGGVMAFPIPEDFSADNLDWLHELDLPEWQDDTLG
ncbi:MAG: M56 family metallopeptidase, partial [Faecousia sp.]